jgi:hypothetical protein
VTEIFVDPEIIQDVLAAFTAIASLVECCDNIFASDEAGVRWWASGYLLLVVRHWASLMANKRTELRRCRVLSGLAKKILLQITGQLPTG